MKHFNLSAWALGHRSFVYFLMAISMIAGVFAYEQLGREEDPPFTIKTMLIQAQWPGATIEDTMQQVTERIEKEVRQIDALDYVKSYTTPGQVTVYVYLKDTTKPSTIPWIWYQVRKRVNDIKGQLPQDVQGPVYNDEFGDVFGNVYAFTGDGMSYRQLRDAVEYVRRAITDVPGLGKTQVLGDRAEVIFLDFSTRKLAQLGLDRKAVIQSIQAQNAVTATGVVQAESDRVSLRVSGGFQSEDSLREINLRINGRFFRLSDLGEISRGYEEPPQFLFRFNGEPGIALAMAMQPGANILTFGEALKERMRAVQGELPVGFKVSLVSNQPAIVEESVHGFLKALVEAVVIVLAVSFVSLGFRAGLVVSISIPLVLALTFVVMLGFDVTLQRISLGALIIALGLLVDDAMITVEMMVSRLEAGDPIEEAATFAYTSTAFPMLTGTLVTVLSFLPIGFNSSSAGYYTYSLFVVIAASLMISWVVAILFAPLLGVLMLPKAMKKHDETESRLMRVFRALLLPAMRWRWTTVIACVALLVLSVFGMRFVQQQFFPASDRAAFLIDMTLPQGSTIEQTRATLDRLEENLKGDADIVRWSSYVGVGAIRFYLSLDPQPSNAFFAQVVVETKDLETRGQLIAKLKEVAREKFVGTDVFVHTLELGPPVGRPVQYRLSGPDIQAVRTKAMELAKVMSGNAHLEVPVFDWNEPGKVLRVDILQDKARQLGVTSEDIATLFNSIVGGGGVTQVRDAIYLISVVGRAQDSERHSLDTFRSLQVPVSNGSVVPLLAFASLSYDVEQPIVWRRGRLPTITVKASIHDEAQAPTVVKELEPAIAAFKATLPSGYKLAIGGEVEESGKSQGPILGVVPVMLIAMAFFLMVQLQSLQKLFIVASVAPLGLIGVVVAMLASSKPLGFVAILGVLALVGIIIRNSVILVTQIDEYESEGRDPWHAVVEASCHRMRPILLTAAAACLAMIPIAREVFWGPMAYAMIGGIIAATLLTLFFLPALYVGWYRIKETPDAPKTQQDAIGLPEAAH